MGKRGWNFVLREITLVWSSLFIKSTLIVRTTLSKVSTKAFVSLSENKKSRLRVRS